MYIVLDTNIWYTELGLSSARGAALKYYVNKKGAMIALPDVVKREVEFNLRKALNEARANVEANHRKILSVFGQLKEIVLPTPDEIDSKVSSLFDDLGVELEHVPFSMKSAEHALSALISSQPPNGHKDQQFKDSVVWADCLQLLDQDDVALVTGDKGFYHDRDYKKGLASNLREESDDAPNDLRIYSSLNELLEEIAEPVELDHGLLVKDYLSETHSSVEGILDRNGFVIEGEPGIEVSSFVTEQPYRLYVDFRITFSVSDVTEAGRSNGVLVLKGDAFYDTSAHCFSDIRNKGEELNFEDAEGEQQRKSVVMMVGNIVLGHRSVEHTIRHKIE
ncbi:PIN domain-containing protein [Halomonas sp. C05BenzN]|uniref:PIN domain-containing protein n=1 Tax=Halomonas sp. C05BenzN TaxID=3411041 RepID=UPI003B92F4CB